MNDKIIKKEFFRFLKNNGAFSAFKYNFKNQSKLRLMWCNDSKYAHLFCNGLPDNSIEAYINSLKRPSDLFNFCFSWVNTAQGGSYWNNLSCKWIRSQRGLLTNIN